MGSSQPEGDSGRTSIGRRKPESPNGSIIVLRPSVLSDAGPNELVFTAYGAGYSPVKATAEVETC